MPAVAGRVHGRLAGTGPAVAQGPACHVGRTSPALHLRRWLWAAQHRIHGLGALCACVVFESMRSRQCAEWFQLFFGRASDVYQCESWAVVAAVASPSVTSPSSSASVTCQVSAGWLAWLSDQPAGVDLARSRQRMLGDLPKGSLPLHLSALDCHWTLCFGAAGMIQGGALGLAGRARLSCCSCGEALQREVTTILGSGKGGIEGGIGDQPKGQL